MENKNNLANAMAEEKKKEGRRFYFTTETAKEVQQAAPVQKIGLIDGIITPRLDILAAPAKFISVTIITTITAFSIVTENKI